jgi:predicted  nucleic acid-binding Zn-ribbon protein
LNRPNKLSQETDREWHDLLRSSEVAKDDLSHRKEQEIEARKALVRAQQMVTEAKAHLVTTSNALKGVEQRVRRNAYEMDRVTSSLAKKQERVRLALRQKVDRTAHGLRFDYAEDVEALRQKESRLSVETTQVSMMVARLQSRAEKLKVRADALEKWQQAGGDSGIILNGKTP